MTENHHCLSAFSFHFRDKFSQSFLDGERGEGRTGRRKHRRGKVSRYHSDKGYGVLLKLPNGVRLGALDGAAVGVLDVGRQNFPPKRLNQPFTKALIVARGIFKLVVA